VHPANLISEHLGASLIISEYLLASLSRDARNNVQWLAGKLDFFVVYDKTGDGDTLNGDYIT